MHSTKISLRVLESNRNDIIFEDSRETTESDSKKLAYIQQSMIENFKQSQYYKPGVRYDYFVKMDSVGETLSKESEPMPWINLRSIGWKDDYELRKERKSNRLMYKIILALIMICILLITITLLVIPNP